MKRHVGTLQKMVEAALAGSKGVKWSHVLHYLESHAVSDDAVDNIKLPFPSPLPAYYVPNDDLKAELWYEETGESVLRTALKGAPYRIVAALCHLCPETLSAPDPQGRLPLHHLCRRKPTDESNQVMQLIISAYPSALVHRDQGGRTPLHWLFWYHPAARTPEIVAAFCQKLPKTKFYSLKQHQDQDKKHPLPEIPRPSSTNKVNHNAAIVHDACHGCLPLHYAVMQGASLEAIQTLLQAYPLSKHVTDRYGRTALHWYLGAGSLIDKAADVSGEAAETSKSPSPFPHYWNRSLSLNVIRLLISSRVARTADAQGRYPLHWAGVFLAYNYYQGETGTVGSALPLDCVQFLLDHYASQIACRDSDGRTPCMILLDAFAHLQETAWNAALHEPPHVRRLPHDLVHGGPAALDMPVELMRLFLEHPDQAAAQTLPPINIEDNAGRLPLHAALEVAASKEIVSYLVESHPASLIHSTEEFLMVPLHSAFCREATAPLQTERIVQVILKAYTASRHGTFVDGRLAIKMEDSVGCYPIHYACQNKACVNVIKLLVEKYPKSALFQKPDGNLPVHCLLDDDELAAVTSPHGLPASAGTEEDDFMLQAVSATRSKMAVLLPPLLLEPAKLELASTKGGLLPLHCGVAFQAAPYPILLQMLNARPDTAPAFTGDDVALHAYSALDLHEFAKEHSYRDKMEQWHRVRELLFSFAPTLESHRHREELLDRCVRIVIQESDGTGSYHLDVCRAQEVTPPSIWATHTLSNMEVPKQRRSRRARKGKSVPAAAAAASSSNAKGVAGANKSHKSAKTDNDGSNPKAGRRKKGGKGGARRNTVPLPLAPSRNSQMSSAKDGGGSQQQQRPQPSPATSKQASAAGGKKISMYDDDNTSFHYDVSMSGSYPEEDEESFFSEEQSFEEDESYSSENSFREEGDTFTDEEGESTDGASTTGEGQDTDGASTAGGDHSEGGSSGDPETDAASSVGGEESGEEPDSFSINESGTYGSRTVTFDEEATSMEQASTFDTQNDASRGSRNSRGSVQTLDEIFENAKRKAEVEEKKDDPPEGDLGLKQKNSGLSIARTPRSNNKTPLKLVVPAFSRPQCMSEVGFRLWTFFALYCDPNNPGDNYVNQVGDIFDEIEFSTVEDIVGLALPAYAENYLPPGEKVDGATFRDIASPKCRELIHKKFYFVAKYDFELGDLDTLMKRSADGSSVTVRANEWVFTTEELTDAINPGISEAAIWATGTVPAEVGVTFKSAKRPVWIKFTNNKDEYESEIMCRTKLGLSLSSDAPTMDAFVPLLSHYNATSSESKSDRSYKVDINDGRFKTLKLFSSVADSGNKTVSLDSFPFALVYPASSYGTMADYYRRYGVDSSDEIKDLSRGVMKAVNVMHDEGLIHGNLSMHNVTLSSTNENEPRVCYLNHFACSARFSDDDAPSYLGRIGYNGRALFNSGTMPPEFFVKLSADDLRAYRLYWKTVKRLFGVLVDKSAIEPFIDSKTGEAYVVRCWFDPTGAPNGLDHKANKLPNIPYKLLRASQAVDVWALGQMLFAMCAGRPLFPVQLRDNALLEYGSVCDCNEKKVAQLIFENIRDPLAQDVLFRLLAPADERASMTIPGVLGHPYFAGSSTAASVIRSIAEKRKSDTAAYKRGLLNTLQALCEENWLANRTTEITTWDFELLKRIHFSPAEIARRMMPRKSKSIMMPCSLLLLPYKLCRNKALLLTPGSKADVEKAERLGSHLVSLSKACHFARAVKQAIFRRGSPGHKWSSSEVIRVLDLSSEDFGDVQSEMANLAAWHVETFRDDPMKVVTLLVQQKIKNLLSFFDEESVYLYLVDENTRTPILDGVSPIEVPKAKRSEVLRRGIFFMMLTCLYSRGVSEGLTGLVKLIFEAADPHVPPSWTTAGRGLGHELDEKTIVSELDILRQALSETQSDGSKSGTLSGSADKHMIEESLQFMREFVLEMDPSRSLANMRRVVASEASLWTTLNGVRELETVARNGASFTDALRLIKHDDDRN